MNKERKQHFRQKNSPTPIDIAPVLISRGWYLNIVDYARHEGITRLTAYNRAARGEIKTLRVGPKTVLVKVKIKK